MHSHHNARLAEGPSPPGDPSPGVRSHNVRACYRERNHSPFHLPLTRQVSVRRSSLSGESTKHSLYPVADTRLATAAAARGSRPPAAVASAHRSAVASPFSTVARVLNRLGLGRLRNLAPKPPVRRYEWERPGDLIHIDVKSLVRFQKVRHWISLDRQKGRSYGVGYENVQVAIDDATRLAFVECCRTTKIQGRTDSLASPSPGSTSRASSAAV